jgi:hypothetical protein
LFNDEFVLVYCVVAFNQISYLFLLNLLHI